MFMLWGNEMLESFPPNAAYPHRSSWEGDIGLLR